MGSGGDSSDTGAVFNLLRVLADPGGYKSKLAEFDKRRDAAQQAEAAAAGPIQAAQEAADKANELMTQAQAKMTEAQEMMDAAVKLKEGSVAANALVELRQKEAETQRKALTDNAFDIEARSREVANKLASANKRIAKAEEMEVEADRKKAAVEAMLKAI